MVHPLVSKRIEEERRRRSQLSADEYAKNLAISFAVCPDCAGRLVKADLLAVFVLKLILGLQHKYKCADCGKTHKITNAFQGE